MLSGRAWTDNQNGLAKPQPHVWQSLDQKAEAPWRVPASLVQKTTQPSRVHLGKTG